MSSGRGRDVLGYLALSHGWTWLFWGAAILWGREVWSSPAAVLVIVGGLGPPLGGVVMTGRIGGRAGLRELLRRSTDPRRIALRWWAAICLLVPALTAAAATLALLAGVAAPPLDLRGAASRLADPAALLLFAGTILLLGPLPEEIGWRGYLLDRLQARRSALAASLLVGVAWATWHLPLYFVPGYFGAYRPEAANWMLSILVVSVLYAWIHNNTERSVLAVILFHFSENFTGELFAPSAQVRLYRTLLTALLVALVVARWGPRRLRRGAERPAEA